MSELTLTEDEIADFQGVVLEGFNSDYRIMGIAPGTEQFLPEGVVVDEVLGKYPSEDELIEVRLRRKDAGQSGRESALAAD